MTETMNQEHDGSIFADIDEESEEQFSAWQRNLRLWKETITEQFSMLTEDPLVVAAMAILAFFGIVAVFAPYIAPYGPKERLMVNALFAKWIKPSFLGGEGGYILGTTAQGYDIFSQLVYGARPAIMVGLVAAVMTVGLGTLVGLVSGYYGGYVDDVLMRLVDFVYGLPLLPTVIVLVTVLGPGLENIILAFVLLQWRTSARVIRALVLSLRERSFVKAAKISGASNWRIISRHIAPNVL
ncbi:ABC transporter permease, partial [Haladaptatus sp. W1]